MTKNRGNLYNKKLDVQVVGKYIINFKCSKGKGGISNVTRIINWFKYTYNRITLYWTLITWTKTVQKADTSGEI